MFGLALAVMQLISCLQILEKIEFTRVLTRQRSGNSWVRGRAGNNIGLIRRLLCQAEQHINLYRIFCRTFFNNHLRLTPTVNEDQILFVVLTDLNINFT